MSRKIFLAIWLTAGLTVHLLMELLARHVGNGEPYISELAYMTILSFPTGVVVPFLWTGIIGILHGTIFGLVMESNTILTNFLTWLTYISFGYIQWFILVPKIIIRVKKWHTPKS